MSAAPARPGSVKAWEEAVLWLKSQPDRLDLVRDCYFDDPLEAAARRFHAGGEWRAARDLLPRPAAGARALDLGAGRGISAYALARDGWSVTALEPDPSPIVGAGAIRQLAEATGLDIAVVEARGEDLAFPEAWFDVVHARQVLHHARDLGRLCREVFRVLKPGGLLLATREHVISRAEDLGAFLSAHPLHARFGGENAFTLAGYVESLRSAGFRLKRILAPWESDINLHPRTLRDVRIQLAHELRFPFPRLLPAGWVKRRSRRLETPGRLYSFLGSKP